MSLASIVTVASCTLIFGISYFISSNLNGVLANIEQGMAIVVYVDDNISESQLEILETRLSDIEQVARISFTSREEATANFVGDNPLFAGLGYDFLPASFELQLNNVDAHGAVSALVLEFDYVYNVQRVDQAVLDTITDVTRTTRWVSVIVVFFLAIISTVIIVNTIKITVSARQNEISIMKYVGATDWFIRWPFLMEGIMIGLFGAMLSLVVSYLIYAQVFSATVDFLPEADGIFEASGIALREISTIFVGLVPITILMGTGIGVVGSVTSVRRYLKV